MDQKTMTSEELVKVMNDMGERYRKMIVIAGVLGLITGTMFGTLFLSQIIK